VGPWISVTPSSRRELPPATHRSGREPLDSSGSCRPVIRSCSADPCVQTGGCPFPDAARRCSRTPVTAFQPLVVIPSVCPVHQVTIDTPAQRNHCARVKHREGVEPAPAQPGFTPRARSLRARAVRRCIFHEAASRLMSASLPGSTAGKNLVNALPSALLKAFPGGEIHSHRT
jgi:hypothetical protein